MPDVLELSIEQAISGSGQMSQILSSSVSHSYNPAWIAAVVGAQSSRLFVQPYSPSSVDSEGRSPRSSSDHASRFAYEQEKAAFSTLLPDLISEYLGKYVAVHGGVIVDSDFSSSRLVQRFFARHGKVSVFIGLVGGRRTVRGRTPRLGRSYK